jgi:hypothetical protein
LQSEIHFDERAHLCIIKNQTNKNKSFKNQFYMKSKLSILTLALVLSYAAKAAAPMFVSVKPTAKAEVFNIHYKSTEAGNVRVSILDKNNSEVFTETLFNVISFVRPYNFSELSVGEYTIVIADKNGKQAEKINYTLNHVESFISVSEVANKENKYLLNVTNNGTENIYVRILAKDGTSLHEQILEVTGKFSLIYDLNKVKPTTTPSVTFEITSGNGKMETIKF